MRRAWRTAENRTLQNYRLSKSAAYTSPVFVDADAWQGTKKYNERARRSHIDETECPLEVIHLNGTMHWSF